jgi:hypothetical protein
MDALRHIVRVLRVASRAAEKRVGPGQLAESERQALAQALRRLVLHVGDGEGVPAMFLEDAARGRRRGDSSSRLG